MLFRNRKTGNIVDAKNEDAVGIMLHSDNYEVVKPEPPAPTAKKTKKPAKTKAGK